MSEQANVEALRQRLAAISEEAGRLQGGLGVVDDRIDGITGALGTATDGSSSDDITEALGLLAKMKVAIGEQMQSAITISEKIAAYAATR